MGHHTHEGKYISYEKGKEKKKNKGLTLEVRLLGIVQMWLKSLTLDKINKIKHYIRIKTHYIIVLRFHNLSMTITITYET